LFKYKYLLILLLFHSSTRGPLRHCNRPGFGTPIEVIGKFKAHAAAASKISSRYERTTNTDCHNSLPMIMMTEVIINRYHPGDPVVIVMSQPPKPNFFTFTSPRKIKQLNKTDPKEPFTLNFPQLDLL
jgi:hypothetical protein